MSNAPRLLIDCRWVFLLFEHSVVTFAPDDDNQMKNFVGLSNFLKYAKKITYPD